MMASTPSPVVKISRRQRRRDNRAKFPKETNQLVRKRRNERAAKSNDKAVEGLDETEYSITRGLRHVKPYLYTFNVHAKGRWYKNTLLDVLTNEFKANTIPYYQNAIAYGAVTVNKKVVAPSYVIQPHDTVQHLIHRHEPPVRNKFIELVSNRDNLLVVNKPSSIPIHPSGRYRHNTLLFILAKEYGFSCLFPIHRIDRLTSGLVLLAKKPNVAREYSLLLRKRELSKRYLALVEGRLFAPKSCICNGKKLPGTGVEIPDVINNDNCSKGDGAIISKLSVEVGEKERVQVEVGDIMDVNLPIKLSVKGRGINEVHMNGKPARTIVVMLGYSSDMDKTLVLCKPYSGRTHQIRLHLKWLGTPIVGDPLYGNKGDLLQKEFDEVNKYRHGEGISSNHNACKTENMVDRPSDNNAMKESRRSQSGSSMCKTTENNDASVEDFVLKHCPDCKVPPSLKYGKKKQKNLATKPLWHNMSTNENVIDNSTNNKKECTSNKEEKEHEYLEDELCLHSYYYACDDFQFITSLPPWSLLFTEGIRLLQDKTHGTEFCK